VIASPFLANSLQQTERSAHCKLFEQLITKACCLSFCYLIALDIATQAVELLLARPHNISKATPAAAKQHQQP